MADFARLARKVARAESSKGVLQARRRQPRASYSRTRSSKSILTGREPANQRALDHSQSSGRATTPRGTGLAWMQSIMARQAAELVMLQT